jgi:hypothetical protein
MTSQKPRAKRWLRKRLALTADEAVELGQRGAELSFKPDNVFARRRDFGAIAAQRLDSVMSERRFNDINPLRVDFVSHAVVAGIQVVFFNPFRPRTAEQHIL